MSKEIRRKIALLAITALMSSTFVTSPEYIFAEELMETNSQLLEEQVPTEEVVYEEEPVEQVTEEQKTAEEITEEEAPTEETPDEGDVKETTDDNNIDKKNEDTYRALRYALFSGSQVEDLRYFGWKMNVNGDIHSNSKVIAQCTEFNVSGKCEYVDDFFWDGYMKNIGQEVKTTDDVIPTTDLSKKIDSIMDKKPVKNYDDTYFFTEDTVNMDHYIYVNGYVFFRNSNFSGDGIIKAKNNITFNLNNFKSGENNKVLYYVTDGNINIDATNSEINGILYAPKGKVIFNGYNLKINGRIIADQIVLNGSLIEINASESDLEMLNSAPEIKLDETKQANFSTPTKLSAEVSDEGLINKDLELKWSKVSGPGEVTFSDENSKDTEVIVSEPGEYEFSLSANDGELITTENIKVTFNKAPEVDIIAPQGVKMDEPIDLSAKVIDDGLINKDLKLTWSKISGPGEVTFSNPDSVNTSISVSQEGTYVLQLTADDGMFKTSKEVTISVEAYTSYGTATVEDDTIILTELKTFQSGGIWYDNATDTTKGFEVNFKYWIGGGREYSGGGADGIVVNLAPSKGSFGSAGGNLNFNGKGTYGVEFDSFTNEWDPAYKHIAIINESVSNHLIEKHDDRVDDSQWHDVKVVYKDNTLFVYLDGSLELQQDEIKLNDTIYVGLSGATGGSINKHIVKGIKVTPYK